MASYIVCLSIQTEAIKPYKNNKKEKEKERKGKNEHAIKIITAKFTYTKSTFPHHKFH